MWYNICSAWFLDINLVWYFQYLGTTGVSKTHGAGSTDDAVKHIIHDVSCCIMYCITIVTPCVVPPLALCYSVLWCKLCTDVLAIREYVFLSLTMRCDIITLL